MKEKRREHLIDKARLERQLPWWRKNGGKEEVAGSSSSSSWGGGVGGSTSTETTTFASNGHPTSSTSSSWRNTLPSETLISMLKLKETMENVQSFVYLRTNDASNNNNSNYYFGTNSINGNTNWLLYSTSWTTESIGIIIIRNINDNATTYPSIHNSSSSTVMALRRIATLSMLVASPGDILVPLNYMSWGMLLSMSSAMNREEGGQW